MNFEDFADKSIQISLDLGAEYCDVRSESYSSKKAVIENGQTEQCDSIIDTGIGIRILKNGVWGFCSISNPGSFETIREKIADAIHSTQKFSNKIKFSKEKTHQSKKDYPVKKTPTLEELIKIGTECDSIIREKRNIIKSTVNLYFKTTSKYYADSYGSRISQNYTDTIVDLIATARESGITQSINITEGGRGGIEKISNEANVLKVADEISDKASKLVYAKPIKEEKTTLVFNPDFVSLLTHEILGHPSEADRVLGKEMAWAGGSWWAGKLGEEIGSSELNVFDDPSVEGTLGWYDFDDEGMKSSRTNIIEKGVLKGHLQNNETSKIFEVESNANMRATSYKFMPLIRMACTCIDKGDWNPDEIIKDVKSGYLISNMKIPSIDMKRYNWSISCQYANKIENGEITDLQRDVIVMGTAPEFFRSIDACGNDFTIRPITNCGKGDPMQSMMMGNGGPTIKAVATVKSTGETKNA
ncbi:MAG: TldD/PmbA family protein [Crenarchaeota archaeon]|nr:MAG: TldD/PmbA family protein [Thermoproteota archaeon]RDJ32826.1 MAG: TldD/PmbA family protein [Thermoproteota archaeon]RDJ37995.1 MAG: TldD/PmbA family protein [Thermoproteota archaeon]RDJ38341.1 MAG: TldD/PmbA family protein [Thermoproteota archaeon]